MAFIKAHVFNRSLRQADMRDFCRERGVQQGNAPVSSTAMLQSAVWQCSSQQHGTVVPIGWGSALDVWLCGVLSVQEQGGVQLERALSHAALIMLYSVTQKVCVRLSALL